LTGDDPLRPRSHRSRSGDDRLGRGDDPLRQGEHCLWLESIVANPEFIVSLRETIVANTELMLTRRERINSQLQETVWEGKTMHFREVGIVSGGGTIVSE
jgi:hypothetical protein